MAEVLINLDDISINFSGREIFSGLSWEIQNQQRVGLVGPNGAGKSTLMRIVAGELIPDDGNMFRVSGLTIGRLDQEPVLDSEHTILAEALTAVPELQVIEAQLKQLEGRMGDPAVYENPDQLEAVMGQHGRLLDTYENLGGSRLDSTVKSILTRLGFPQDRWQNPVRNLSGGEKKLLLLAKLIVRRPRLLLLDEPDNHLDVPAKERLEKVINSYPGCVVIISHDRYLLDEITSHIAELENGRLTLYPGNYTAYTTERELRRLRQQQLYEAQQKEIARIEAAIARFELWASIVVDERHIRQARSRQKMLERMDKIEKVTDGRRMGLEMSGWRGSNKALELDDVGKMLPNGRILWDSLDLTLWHGERVGLVGDNGVGKSLLLKQLHRPEEVDQGQIKIGPSCKIGYYTQEHESLDYSKTLLETVRHAAPLSESVAVAFLNKFLYRYDQIRDKIGNLSGGERSRLQFALLMLQNPNFLLLDEPTNNLDITSIEVLEQVLDEFEGTVLVISHDRYFLDKVVDRIVELKDGRFVEFLGGYTDYLLGDG
ncbi:MAG: ABC-F family ATP-binding cassette domain-containing protein [Ardenticatenaceae bacterium]|nr:ABC-F family ATP-binding cassette domain-containing protein [Ardenticatenaceae bacterium]